MSLKYHFCLSQATSASQLQAKNLSLRPPRNSADSTSSFPTPASVASLNSWKSSPRSFNHISKPISREHSTPCKLPHSRCPSKNHKAAPLSPFHQSRLSWVADNRRTTRPRRQVSYP